MSNLFDEAIKGISVRFENKNKKIAELEARIKELEQAQEEMVIIINAVAHVGVDFGFGEYVLEQQTIDKARGIVESLPQQPEVK